jgi:hypothetical protein
VNLNALASLTLFSICTIAYAAPTTQPVAEIHSIDELQRQPLVHLTNGKEFRFAVQRAAPEFGDAWIIYCLQTKGGVEPAHNGRERELDLGSLHVNWEPTNLRFAEQVEQQADGRTAPVAPALTCWMIDPMAGRDVVHFRTGGVEVARAEVTVEAHHISAWRQFSDNDFGIAQTKDGPWLVVADSGAAVLPNMVEQHPFDPRASALPTTQPDQGLKLTLSANAFVVDASKMKMSDDRSLIARWWVNDKPCIPHPDAPLQLEQAEARLEQAVPVLRVRFSLPDDLLGLHAGDRIGVQAMYCPDGWHYADPRADMMLFAQDHLKDGAGIMVSNRLDFILTPKMLDDAKKLVKHHHRLAP